MLDAIRRIGIISIPACSVYSSYDIEHSSANALIATASSNRFIGVQVTRITFQEANGYGSATVNKSRVEIFKILLGLGFIFVMCVFVQSKLCGRLHYGSLSKFLVLWRLKILRSSMLTLLVTKQPVEALHHAAPSTPMYIFNYN